MKYPSVTTILSPWVDFSNVPEQRLIAAAERGREVHKICAAIAKGLWAPVPKELGGYIASFTNWLDGYVLTVHGVELQLMDATYGYMGHPDLVATLVGEDAVCVIDIKTPVMEQRSWACQLAAYADLVEVDPTSGITVVDRLLSLRLSPEGKRPKITEYTSQRQRAFAAFLGALNAWKFLKGE